MASVVPVEGGFRAHVYVKRKRASKTFATERAAKQWAARRETELHAQADKKLGTVKTLFDAFDKYEEEVARGRDGEHWEVIRLAYYRRHLPNLKMSDPTWPDVLATWKAERLRGTAKAKAVGPGTVLRDFSLLSSVFGCAHKEWRWIESNPVHDVAKPPAPPHRERLVHWSEIKRVLRAAGHNPRRVRTVTQAVALSFCLELRTGMRSSEMCRIKKADVHDDWVFLGKTKSGRIRNVPLSRKARMLIERAFEMGCDPVLGLTPSTRDALFRKAKKRAGVAGFTFHDGRHTAATMIARKIDVLDLCKMFGWTDPKQAMVYYNPTASDIARRL